MRHKQRHFSFLHLKGIYYGAALLFILIFFIGYKIIPLPYLEVEEESTEIHTISYNAPITLHFSQPMYKISVEEAFLTYPRLKGVFVWPDWHTLEYHPQKSLKIGEQYRVVLDASAYSIYRKTLNANYTMHFEVTGAPYVQFISPRLPQADQKEITENNLEKNKEISIDAESTENITPEPRLIIPPDQIITIMFDRPMQLVDPAEPKKEISLLKKNQSKDDNLLLKIDPPIEGEYRWLGDTAFQFIPTSWPMGTIFTITVPVGIVARDGGSTEKAIVWQVETPAPRIIEATPKEVAGEVDLLTPITLHFNQEIDLNQIQPGENIQLFPSNDLDADHNPKYDGFFNANITYGTKADGKIDKQKIIFDPNISNTPFPYQYNQDYRFVAKAGLLGISSNLGTPYGRQPLSEDFELNFKTQLKPEVAHFTPSSNTKNYDQDSVVIDFNTPVTIEEISKNINLIPKSDQPPRIEISDDKKQIIINYTFKPSAKYTFELKSFRDIYGNMSEKGFNTTFITAIHTPDLKLKDADNLNFIIPGIDPIYTLETINIKEFQVKICRVSSHDFIVTDGNYNWSKFRCHKPKVYTYKFKETDEEVDKKDNEEEIFINQLQIIDLNLKEIFQQDFENGVYFFTVGADDFTDDEGKPRYEYATFSISNTSLILKKTSDSALVWAMDLKTGKPIDNMSLTFLSKQGQEIKQGHTDKQGVYKIDHEFDEGIYVTGEKNSDNTKYWAITSEYWPINTSESFGTDNMTEWLQADEPRLYFYADRFQYYPGETISFKGIYRIDQDAKLSLFESSDIRIILEDSKENIIEQINIPLNSNGLFNGTFTLSPALQAGQYNLYAEVDTPKLPQRFYYPFYIQNKKTPSFTVAFTDSQSDYSINDPIIFNLKAYNNFKVPINGVSGQWNLWREPYIFNRYHNTNYYYSFAPWKGEFCLNGKCTHERQKVKEGHISFDQNGEGRIRLWHQQKPTLEPGYFYTLQVEAKNNTGAHTSQQVRFIIHPGEYYLGLSSKNYLINPGNDLELNLIAVAPQGNLIDDERVTITLQPMLSLEEDKPPSFQETILTTKGVQNISFSITDDIKSGAYLAKAVSKDRNGNIVQAEIRIYIGRPGNIRRKANPFNRVVLVPDQPEYLVGGKARLLIQSPYSLKDLPAKALITYERAGILHYEVIELRSKNTWLYVPIQEDMVPNVHISVMMIRPTGELWEQDVSIQDEKMLENSMAKLYVEMILIEDELNTILAKKVDERTDQEKKRIKTLQKKLDVIKTKQGNQVKQNSNSQSKKIYPELTTGTVNLAVSKREKEIAINFKEIDSPTKGKLEIEIQTYDYQNRPVPSVVSLIARERSTKNFTTMPEQNPLNYFYANRRLQVETTSNVPLWQKNKDIKNLQKNTNLSSKDITFLNYMPQNGNTIYFNPSIETDAGGKAHIEIDSPHADWYIWAIATSDLDHFGATTVNFNLNKSIVIKPVTPYFLFSGDHSGIGANVYNNSSRDQEIKIELISKDLNIKEEATKTIFIRAGTKYRVDWNVEVLPTEKDKNITIAYQAHENHLEHQLLIKNHLSPIVVRSSGEVDDQYSDKLQPPHNITTKKGTLKIRLGATLAVFLERQMQALSQYPHHSFEYNTSQLLADLYIQRLLKHYIKTDTDIAIWGVFESVILNDRIQEALVKLNKYQHFDGGYSFWPETENSDPWLTAYALYALHFAKEADYLVDQQVVDKAVQFLWSQLNQENVDLNITSAEQIFILWVLSEVGQYDTKATITLFKKRVQMPIYARALMLMNIQNLYHAGQKSVYPFIVRLKSELVSEQIIDNQLVYFEEDIADHMNTNWRTTAMVLMALNRTSGDNPISPSLIRALITKQSSVMKYTNTQEITWILMALVEYTEANLTFKANYNFTVDINNQTVTKDTVDMDHLWNIYRTTLPLENLTLNDEAKDIVIKKEGEGSLYFDNEMTYYLDKEEISPQGDKILITRAYYEANNMNTIQPLNIMKTGELYRGHISLVIPKDMSYAVIEMPLAAGMMPISFNSKITDLFWPSYQKEEAERHGYNWINNQFWHFNHREIYNDRFLLFADHLPKGVYQYDFFVRASDLPGKYYNPPAYARQMYNPEVFGHTEGEWIEVRD